jgi:ribosomal protein L29
VKNKETLDAFRKKNVPELKAQIHQNNKDLYELRAKAAVGQMAAPHLVRRLKKDIARCNTIISEAEAGK